MRLPGLLWWLLATFVDDLAPSADGVTLSFQMHQALRHPCFSPPMSCVCSTPRFLYAFDRFFLHFCNAFFSRCSLAFIFTPLTLLGLCLSFLPILSLNLSYLSFLLLLSSHFFHSPSSPFLSLGLSLLSRLLRSPLFFSRFMRSPLHSRFLRSPLFSRLKCFPLLFFSYLLRFPLFFFLA